MLQPINKELQVEINQSNWKGVAWVVVLCFFYYVNIDDGSFNFIKSGQYRTWATIVVSWKLGENRVRSV